MTSRNSPCWCGSGKRFKLCHGAIATGGRAVTTVAESPDPVKLALTGLEAHRAGDLEEAEALYRASLAADPDNADVLHMLGVVRMSLQDLDEAKTLIERAGTLTQWRYPGFRHNYGYLLSAYLSGRNAAPSHDDETVRAALETLRRDARNRGAARGRQAHVAVFATSDHAVERHDPKENLRISTCRWFAASGETLASAVDRLLDGAGIDADFVTFATGGTALDTERLAQIVGYLDASGAGWGFSGIEVAAEVVREVRQRWPKTVHTLLQGLANANARFTKNLSAMCLAAPALPTLIDNVVIRRSVLRASACPAEPFAQALPSLVLDLCRQDDPVFAADASLRPTRAQIVAVAESWPDTEAGIRTALRRYIDEVLSGATFANPLAPNERRDGLKFLKRPLRNGVGAYLDAVTLQEIAGRVAADERAQAHWLRDDGFDLVGFVRTESGLGENLRAIARACQAAHIPVAASDIDLDVGMRKGDDSCAHLIAPRPRYRHKIIFSNPDFLCEAFHHEGASAIDRAHRIGYWAWELEKPPSSWLTAARLLDELWVPSEFVRKAFAAAVAIPVHTLPAPIRLAPSPRPSRRYTRAELGLADDEIVFLFSFAYGSLAARKNPWAVVRAFRDAFPRHVGGVRLLMKSVQSELFEAEAATLRDLAGDDPRIRFLDGFMSRDQLTALQAACDCFVSLHRSEGFGLGLAECMALGKTVIATAYSGNLDFMREDNSLLVDYRLVSVEPGEYPDTQGQVWADASIESAARKMRDAYADRDLRTRLGRAAAAHIEACFSERAIGERLRTHLRRLSQSAGTVWLAAGPPPRP